MCKKREKLKLGSWEPVNISHSSHSSQYSQITETAGGSVFDVFADDFAGDGLGPADFDGAGDPGSEDDEAERPGGDAVT